MLLSRQVKGTVIRSIMICTALFMLLLGMSSLSAQGVSSIAQGFQTDNKDIASGALVSLKQQTPNTVELSTTQNLDRILGVAEKASLIELSSGATAVKVATTGNAQALVSDINGTVQTGDRITVSPIAGVGMKATISTIVIGVAQSNLSDSKTETHSVTDKSGKQQPVHIGAIQMQVDKVFYQAPEDQNSFVPAAWQDFANRVAGHQVSPVRVMVASLIILLLIAAVSALLYSAVHSSIISIGRNPLSEQAVHKGLLEVGLSIVGILLFSAIVIYLILTT